MHQEAHFKQSDLIRDVVIGMADGLTVPFALAAGLTGAVQLAHAFIQAGEVVGLCRRAMTYDDDQFND